MINFELLLFNFNKINQLMLMSIYFYYIKIQFMILLYY